MEPQLVAHVKLYTTENGGKTQPAYLGWGCPCMATKMQPLSGYDGWPLLGDSPLYPGEERRVGFVFLSPEGAETLKRAGHFYLWEGRFVGEADVVGP
jgi:hypothetical protein